MIVEEMCDWWSNNWGWHYPLQQTIDNIKNDNILKLSLLKIKKRCSDSFVDYFMSFTGIPENQKQKYFNKKFGDMY
jgi:hypothetical protein